MIKKPGYFILFVITIAAVVACNRDIVTTTPSQVVVEGYDTTLYNLTYSEAIKQKMLGNISEATEYFEQAIRINPASDASYFAISQIAVERGDLKTALKYARKAHEKAPENIWYLSNSANLYYLNKDLDSVEYFYKKMVDLYPEREDFRFNIGALYLEQGKNSEAEEMITELYNKYPEDPQICMALLNVKKVLGKSEQAESILRKLTGSDPENINYSGMLAELYSERGEADKATEIYEQMYIQFPDNGLLLMSYLDFLNRQNEYGKIEEIIRTVAANESISKEDKVNLFASILSNEEIGNNLKQELIEVIKGMNSEEPGDATLTLLLAEFLGRTGSLKEEIEILNEYIKINPDNYFIWEKLLLALNEQGNIEELYKRASESSSRFNRFPLPKILYAFAATDKGELDLALNELSKVRVLTNNDQSYLIQILSLEADILFRQGNRDEAFKRYDEALTINPEDELILNNYSYFLAESNQDLKRAREMIERCLELTTNATYLDTYAWVLYKMKKYKEANRIMEEIFSNGEIQDPEHIEHLGYIKAALDLCNEATSLWQMALRLDPDKVYLIEEIDKCLGKELK